MKIAVIFNQFGPYHYARLNAAGRLFHTYGIELFSTSKDYAWDVTGLDQDIAFEKRTLFKVNNINTVSKDQQKRAVMEALNEIAPDAVAVNGWSEAGALAALKWCLTNKVPAIAMSDSTEFDVTRTKLKEIVKKQIVKGFSSAIVAGKPQKDYIEKLGMPASNIFFKYDVVDNAYFKEKSSLAQQNEVSYRERLSLPQKYFLASARFIEKKNLLRLLKGYALYRSKASVEAWNLIVLGDGEMRAELEELLTELEIRDYVQMSGFKQYHEIPVYYSLASVFIHASTSEQWGLVVNEAMACGLPILLSDRCGCAQDLVEQGKNGLLFDPFNIKDIAAKMLAISDGTFNLKQMSESSRQIISEFSPEAFASNLEQSALKAISSRSKQFNIMNSLTLNLLVQ